jgi:hypothetical protein
VKPPDPKVASPLRRFLARPREDRLLLLEALAALAAGRARLLCLPFRRVAARLGRAGAESPEAVPAAQEDTARRIGWAVTAMARYVPWDSRCLAQAIAGQRMLARRGLDCTLYLGVGEDPLRPGDKAFHAWLRCGTRFVTGGDGRLRFQVLASFARTGRP